MSHLLYLDCIITCCINFLPLVPVPDVSLNSITVIAGNIATFTCTITVSNFVVDNGLSLASTSLNPSGTKGSVSKNGRVFTVPYAISNVNTGNAGVYTCQATVQHDSNSNILTSDAGSGSGTLSIQSEYMLLLLYNLNIVIYNLIYRILGKS